MRLDPEIKAKVEAVIGKEVPHPATPEFDELLEELRGGNPELASLLESGVVYDDMPFPEEEVRPRVEKREKLRMLKNLLLNRYDSLTGEWVPSRPKQIMVGFAAFLLFFIPFFLISNRPKGKGSASTAGPHELVDGQDINVNATQEELMENAPPEEEAMENAPPEEEAMENVPPDAALPEENALEAEGVTTTDISEEGDIPPDELASSPPPPPPPPPPPEGEVPSPPPMNSYLSQKPPFPGLSLYRRTERGVAPSVTAEAGERAEIFRAGGGPVPSPESEKAASGLSIYSRKGAPSSYTASFYREKTSSQPMVHASKTRVAESFTGTPSQFSGASSGTETENSAGGGQEGGPVPSNEPRVHTSGGGFYLYRVAPNPPQDRGQSGAPTGEAGTSPNHATTSSEEESSLSVEASVVESYPPGTRLKGHLPITLILPEGKHQPVVVEAKDGALFLGEAFLNEVRRVEIHFTSVIKNGLEEPINAIALGPDGAHGLPATVREEAPSLAADLLRGALRGFSDYLQAAAQSFTVIIGPEGERIQEKGVLPLEDFLAAAAADLFSLPQGAKAVIRLAEVKGGTPLSILVLSSNPSSNPRGGSSER